METKKRNWRMIRCNGLFDMLTNTANPIFMAIVIVLTSFIATSCILYLTEMEDIKYYLDSSYEEVKELETQAVDLISSSDEYEKKIYNGTAYVTPLYKTTTVGGYRYTLRYRNKPYGTYEIQICITTTKEGKVVDMWPDVTKGSLQDVATSILINKAGIISAWIDLLICIIVAIKKELMSQKTEIQTSKI